MSLTSIITYKKEEFYMHTLKIEVNDTILDKVMLFLNNFPKSEIKLSIEEATQNHKPKKLNSISLKTKGFKFDRDEANAR